MTDVFAVPDWLDGLVTKWMKRIGPWGWRVRVNMVSMVNNGGSYDPDVWGQCQQYPHTNRVSLNFPVGLEDDHDTNETVCHECLHAAHANVDHVVTSILIPQLPEEAQQMAYETYKLAYEQYTAAMAAALVDWDEGREKGGVKA